MRRRGFFLNSIVLLLLIPLLLLLATYEDVSSQVIQAQSVRTQAERTYRVASYLELDFQKALEISGKRAVITVVDYVSVTGNFISPTYMVNNTIKDLLLEGNSPSLVGYDPNRVMRGQSLRKWLMNITEELNKQGFEVSPSINDILRGMELTVAPLDAFRIVIKARIPNITIRDVSGRIVYTGSIPSNGGYIYSIVDLQSLEDPLFSAMTGGRYYRSIRACPYSFPEILEKPIKFLEGNGSSTVSHVVGTLSQTVDAEKIFFGDYYPGDGAKAYVLLNEPEQNVTAPIVVNTTLDGVRTSPLNVFNENDMGILVFENVSGASGGAGTTWCSLLGYRVNLTIQNNVGVDLTDYQIPILISASKGFTTQLLDFIFTHTNNTYSGDPYNTNASIAVYDVNCNPIPFWIEYWDPTTETALIWIRTSISADSQLKIEFYFGNEITPTKGNGDSVFEFFDDFSQSWSNKWVAITGNQPYSQTNGELTINGGNSVLALRTQVSLNIYNGFAVRFRMKGDGDYSDWDAGIGLEDSDGNILLFTDDISGGDGLAIHWTWWSYESYTSGRYPITDYDVYEALLKPYSTSYKDTKFKDVSDSRINDDWWNRYWAEPLDYLYLVIDSEQTLRRATYDFIAVRKYTISSDLLEDPFNGITFSWTSTSLTDLVETKPSSTVTTTTVVSGARAYDIQPFIDCIMDQRYFGIYNAPSFFERLEGSTVNHDEYETLAHQMQDELGIKYGNQYYPIGLVSFMIPHATYDEKLFNLFNTLGITPEEGQTSFDYYFLQYYFGGGSKVSGYRVYGISESPDRSSVYFFLDNQTAVAIFGAQGAQDLLQR
ncbi:MAG: DUF2341 domain-containing protein [Thermococcus sp.]|nr:DUF2341 domain-containing protein [Thermococcus sp.]